MEQELADAAEAFVEAPKRLHAAILKAAADGAKPSEITRKIGHVYTADYVARITRTARGGGRQRRKPAAAES